MPHLSPQKTMLFDVGIVASLIAAGIVTYICLNNGIYDVFLYLYIIPVVLITYSHPRFGIYGTIIVGWFYFALVLLWETPDSRLFTLATIRFYIFVSIGILLSVYSREHLKDEQRNRLVYYHSQAGAFSIDKKTFEITDANRKFAAMLGYECEDLIKKKFPEILASPAERESFPLRLRDSAYIADSEIRLLARDKTLRWALVSASNTGNDEIICTAVDISDLKTSQNALMLANRKLNLLSTVTRHDILNKISGVHNFLDLMRLKFSDPALSEYITRLDTTATEVQSLIEKTQVYEDLGSQEPQWQDPDKIVRLLKIPESISLTANLGGWEIFADPMLEKVFFNLLDNSIRHGGHVSRIQVFARASSDGLTISWEDNGSGIGAGEKEHIFEQGFGKNTGLGLFLVREILSLTKICIKETGEPGKGARFEIVVPKGSYRCTGMP